MPGTFRVKCTSDAGEPALRKGEVYVIRDPVDITKTPTGVFYAILGVAKLVSADRFKRCTDGRDPDL